MLKYIHIFSSQEDAMVEKIGYPEICVNKSLLREYYQGVSVSWIIINFLKQEKHIWNHFLICVGTMAAVFYNQTNNLYFAEYKNTTSLLTKD